MDAKKYSSFPPTVHHGYADSFATFICVLITSHEFWTGTDSKVSEGIWHKGGSTDKKLYEIMLDIQEISLESQFLIHLIRVSGLRPIRFSVDGLSRGNL